MVFPSTVGTPMNPDNLVYRSSKPLLRRARLRGIRFHDLRRTFGSLMIEAGEHPKIVQEMLGHSQISLTLDTYSHVLPDIQWEAIGRLGRLPQNALLPKGPGIRVGDLAVVSCFTCKCGEKWGALGRTRPCDPLIRSRLT